MQLDDLMVTTIFEWEEVVISNSDTGEIVYEGKAGNYFGIVE